MHKALLTLGALALLSACASQPKPAVADANKPQNCTSYMETGSMVPKRVCPTAEQQAAQKQENQANVKGLQNDLRMHPETISGMGGSPPN